MNTHDMSQPIRASLRQIDKNPIIGTSSTMQRILARVEKVSATNATVLITGESGVGKELIAERIHQLSTRCDKPFVTLNCASVPGGLFESEFFGHVRGAFTGAIRDRIGRFAAADGGTLFLDEVAEIPVELQSKLLRTLQSKQFEPLGDHRTRQSDVRLIAATNRNLERDVAAGRFRPDLFYRLAVFPVEVPPLRDRIEDVPDLARHIVRECSREQVRQAPEIDAGDLARLSAHSWPGNVRELRNVIERSLITTTGEVLQLELTPIEPVRVPEPDEFLLASVGASRGFLTETELRNFERENMVGALEACEWKVSGPQGAAARLGLKPSTLASRMKSLSIRQPALDSLYCQLGRRGGILALMREIAARVMQDDVLSRFWRNRSNLSLLREEQLLVSFFSDGAGGPMPYVGRTLIESHKSLGIQDDDWHRFVCHVEDALRSLRIPDKHASSIFESLNSVKEQIVDL